MAYGQISSTWTVYASYNLNGQRSPIYHHINADMSFSYYEKEQNGKSPISLPR